MVNFWRKKWFRQVFQVIITVLGLFIIMDLAVRNIGAYTDAGNPLNTRFWMITGIILMSLGWAVGARAKEFWKQFVYRFAEAFGILFIGFLLIGGLQITNDMINDTTYSGGNIWVAFDALADITAGVILVSSIKDAIIGLLPVAIIIIIIASIVHTDMTDEWQGAVTEGLTMMGFYLMYAWVTTTFPIV